MEITILFDGLDAATLSALLRLPYSTVVHTEPSGLYGARVELDTPSDAGNLIDGLIASVPLPVSAPPRGRSESEPGHTAPELIGQRLRVFTFGPDHRHPQTGQSLGGHFVRVPGTALTARERVLEVFGRAFATDYDPATAARLIAKYDMNEINPRPIFDLDVFAESAPVTWHVYKGSPSERRFKIVNELAEAAELEPVPVPDAEDAEAAMAASRWDGPTQMIPTMSGGPA